MICTLNSIQISTLFGKGHGSKSYPILKKKLSMFALVRTGSQMSKDKDGFYLALTKFWKSEL